MYAFRLALIINYLANQQPINITNRLILTIRHSALGATKWNRCTNLFGHNLVVAKGRAVVVLASVQPSLHQIMLGPRKIFRSMTDLWNLCLTPLL